MRRPAFPLSPGPARRAPARRRAGRRGPTPRSGYTLLEVILALAIGAFLMAGLYFALDIQLGRTDSGRKLVERTTVARAVINRIQNDILNNLGPVDPKQAGQNTGGAPSSPSTTTPAVGTTTPTTSPSSSNSTTTANPVNFNLGVQGTSTQLQLYVSRVPGEAIQALKNNSDLSASPSCDLRRITYWLAGSGAGGLARQEVSAVTSDDEIGNLPPNVSDETKYIIHPEVVSLTFEYFDGTTWQSEWDGTQPMTNNGDGSTPQGPPAAIRVTLTFAPPGTAAPPNGQAPAPGTSGAAPSGQTYQYQHVIAIPSANSFVAPAPATPSTPSTTGS